MTYTKNIKEFASFTLWFERKAQGKWSVVEPDSKKLLGEYKEAVKLFVPAEMQDLPASFVEEVRTQFYAFKNERPEYWVGERVDTDSDLIAAYERLLLGSILVRAYRKGLADVDKALPTAMKCIEWLRTTDFYKAPASTVYHESFECGLLHHTMTVYNNIIMLKENIPQFYSVSYDSAAVVALVHDWCKIGLYEKYSKNVKDDATGQWNKVDAFRHKGEFVPLGHGVESLYLASSFFRLTVEESCAIRWHMGAWRVVPSEYDSLQAANENYPTVHLIQFADQLSIVKYL